MTTDSNKRVLAHSRTVVNRSSLNKASSYCFVLAHSRTVVNRSTDDYMEAVLEGSSTFPDGGQQEPPCWMVFFVSCSSTFPDGGQQEQARIGVPADNGSSTFPDGGQQERSVHSERR